MALLNGDERATIRAAQSGSSSDFESIFRSHWPRAYRAAYLILLDHDVAEEVAEEAFLAAVRTLDRFDERRPFGPWLHRIAVNRSVDRARATAARAGTRGVVSPPLEETAPIGWEMPLGGPHTDPGVRAVAIGLAALKPEERAAVVMRLVLDHGPGEACELLEVPRRTLDARLARGLERLGAGSDGATPPTEPELRTLLLAQPVPGEHLAQERTWEIVLPAFAERAPTRPRRSWPWKTLTALALVGIGLGIAFSPAGSAIGGWFRDELGRDRTVVATPPVIQAGLPERGRLLVLAGSRALVVAQSGGRTPLGRWEGTSWSPTGRFATVWRGRELAALDPTEPEVTLWRVHGRRIAGARWSSDELRVAYVSGHALRVVGGNGSDGHRVARGVARVAPAWRPGKEHVLAYAAADGEVALLDPDERQILRRLAPSGRVVALGWTADGERLAVLDQEGLRVFGESGRVPVASVRLPDDVAATALAPRPGRRARDLAYAVFSRTTGVGSIFLLDGKSGTSKLLFSGAGRFDELVWSPTGRLLLVAWPAADQWIYLPPGGSEVVEVVPEVSRAPSAGGGAGVPVPVGWCCSRERR